jgi:hypothetical protein
VCNSGGVSWGAVAGVGCFAGNCGRLGGCGGGWDGGGSRWGTGGGVSSNDGRGVILGAGEGRSDGVEEAEADVEDKTNPSEATNLADRSS